MESALDLLNVRIYSGNAAIMDQLHSCSLCDSTFRDLTFRFRRTFINKIPNHGVFPVHLLTSTA